MARWLSTICEPGMDCPHCAGECRCGRGNTAAPAAAENVTVFIDPDHYDPSEEQFASSLAGEARVDVVTELEAAARGEQVERILTAHFKNLQLPAHSEDEPAVPAAGPEEWREQVADRVRGYRQRRRPQSASATMPLEFEAAEVATMAPASAAPTAQPAPAALPEYQPAAQPAPQSECQPASAMLEATVEGYGLVRCFPNPAPRNLDPFWRKQRAPQSAPESGSLDGGTLTRLMEAVQKVENLNQESQENKIIEFPAPPEPPKEELAEPVAGAPRIFEADEVAQSEREQEELARSVAAPPVPTITLHTEPEVASAEPEFELPLPVAPLSLRASAAVVDGGIALMAGLIFSSVAAGLGVALASRASLTLLLAATLGAWMLYQYLLLTRTGSTLGMRLAGLKLVRFDAYPLTLPRLRARAVSVALSTAALGMGFLWALFDDDRLTWHDRITQTFITRS